MIIKIEINTMRDNYSELDTKNIKTIIEKSIEEAIKAQTQEVNR